MKSSLRVLVVDDEDGIRQMMADFLSDEGHDVDQANSMDSAMELLRTHQYDQALVDRTLTTKDDGIEVAAFAKINGVHVILMSGYENDQTEFPYLCKPFLLPDLIAALEN